MATLKGRNAHKGRTFGGVAACPHCSAPIRVWVTAARVQCVLDVVATSYSLPYPALSEDGPVELDRSTGILAVAGVVSDASETTDTTAPSAASDIAAPSVAHPNERGFDDDEAPFPPGSQGDLGVR